MSKPLKVVHFFCIAVTFPLASVQVIDCHVVAYSVCFQIIC